MLALELVEDLDGSAPELAANQFIVHGLLHVTRRAKHQNTIN
jgi:hypothetical protein